MLLNLFETHVCYLAVWNIAAPTPIYAKKKTFKLSSSTIAANKLALHFYGQDCMIDSFKTELDILHVIDH